MSIQPTDDDALEAELHALRPRELPGRLVRSIEGSIAGDAGARVGRPAPWLRLAAAAVGIAACVALVAFFWRGGKGVTIPPDRAVAVTLPSPGDGGRAVGVTLGEYRAAFSRSPQELEALLERDAPRPPQPEKRTASFRAFNGSALDLLVGEP